MERYEKILKQKGVIIHDFHFFENDYVFLFTKKRWKLLTLGTFVPSRYAILLKVKKDDSLDEIVLIHELAHAALHAVGWGDDNDFNQEDLCNFMAYCGSNITNAAKEVVTWWEREKTK